MAVPGLYLPRLFLIFMPVFLGPAQTRALDLVPAEKTLYSTEISATADNEEFRVLIRALAPGTSWEVEGRECALIRVVVDGRSDQHLFLYQGPVEADYEFLIGPLNRGRHALHLQWDRSWTPELEASPEVRRLDAKRIDRSDPAQVPLLRTPIVHIRSDTIGRFSDVPLLLYYESESRMGGTKLTYSIILSNEDGGTSSERLMARWGRTTDIEWFYAVALSGKEMEETYQARDHKTLPFRGDHEGWHPILYDVTQNNNFADAMPDPSSVRLRMVPIEVDLAGRSREAVMDRFPWTYAIMAKEMEREGKLENPADPRTAKLSDQRNYAYLETCAQQNGTELYFELEVQGQSRWFSSDHSDSRSRIDRNGCFRSSIELPAGTRAEDLLRLRVNCSPAPVPEGGKPVRSPGATIESVNELFMLLPDYRPGSSFFSKKINRKLRPGASLTIPIRQ